MKLRGLVGLCLAAFCSSTIAHAADLAARPYTKAIAAPVQYVNWTGFYAGLAVGYHDGTITQFGCTGLCLTDPKLTGAFLAVSGGADYQFANNVVLGAFITAPVTRLKADFTLVPGVVFNLRPQSAVIGAVRLGYAVNSFLPYIFGGVAYSKIEATSPFGPSPSNEHVGSVIGAGLEYRVAQHWSVDFRYARISLPKMTYDFGGGFEQYGEDSNNYKIAGYYRF